MVIIHTIFAVIKACLAAAVAALLAGVSLLITIIVLIVIVGIGVASVFGFGGSKLAAKRRAKREGPGD